MKAANFIITAKSSEKTDAEIVEMNEFMQKVSVKHVISNPAPNIHGRPSDAWWIMIFYETKEKKEKKEKKESVDNGERESSRFKMFTEPQKSLLAAFKAWRKDKGTETGLKEVDIFPNHVLEAITAIHPRNMLALGHVTGVTKAKLEQFGDEILAICNAF